MGGNIDWTTEKAVGDVLSAMCERTEPGDIVLISSASINLAQPNALEQLNTLLQRADAVALGSDKFFFPPHAFLVEPLAALSALTPSIAHLLSSHAVSSMSLAGIEWLGRKMSPAVLVAAIENLDESSWSVLLKAAAWKPNVLILTSQDRRT